MYLHAMIAGMHGTKLTWSWSEGRGGRVVRCGLCCGVRSAMLVVWPQKLADFNHIRHATLCIRCRSPNSADLQWIVVSLLLQ